MRGGLANVYLCQRDVDPEHVAVKRLHEDHANRADVASLFVRECGLWMLLGRHPNIVTAISTHVVPPEPPVLVLEFVPYALRDRMSEGQFRLAEVLQIALNICDGMRHLQAVFPGIAHLDLKPENVLISEDGVAKVSDFGMVNVRVLVTEEDEPTSTGMAGTPAYMSPEQCLLLGTSQASDIYSFGCVVWEVLTGVHPFPGAVSVDDFLFDHVNTVPALEQGFVGGVAAHDALRDLVASCLEKDPVRRPPSFDVVRERVAVLCREVGVDSAEPIAEEVSDEVILQHAQGLASLGAGVEARALAEQIFDRTDHASGKLWAATVIARTFNDEKNAPAARPWVDAGGGWLEGPGPVIVGAYWNEYARVVDDPIDAARAYKRAMREIPDASVAWANLAVMQYRLGQSRSAKRSAMRALAISRDLRYYQLLVSFHSWDGQPDIAVGYVQRALRDYTNHPEPWVLLADVLIERDGLRTTAESLGARLFALSAISESDPDEWRRRTDELIESVI